MTPPAPKDDAAEREFQARHAPGIDSVTATPRQVVDRYREHRQWRAFRRELIFHLVEQCRPARICDFGCGVGDMSAELGLIGYQVVGFDISPEKIQVCRRRAELDHVTDRVTFVVAHAAESGLPPESFDLVLSAGVLHHIDFEDGLRSIERLLKPGGHAILQEPVAFSRTLQWLRDRTPVEKDTSPNERQLDRADLRQIASRFDVLQIRYFHLLTRLLRIFPPRGRGESLFSLLLHWLDFLLLRIPGMSHFAGNVVLLCRKRPSGVV